MPIADAYKILDRPMHCYDHDEDGFVIEMVEVEDTHRVNNRRIMQYVDLHHELYDMGVELRLRVITLSRHGRESNITYTAENCFDPLEFADIWGDFLTSPLTPVEYIAREHSVHEEAARLRFWGWTPEDHRYTRIAKPEDVPKPDFTDEDLQRRALRYFHAPFRYAEAFYGWTRGRYDRLADWPQTAPVDPATVPSLVAKMILGESSDVHVDSP